MKWKIQYIINNRFAFFVWLYIYEIVESSCDRRDTIEKDEVYQLNLYAFNLTLFIYENSET